MPPNTGQRTHCSSVAPACCFSVSCPYPLPRPHPLFMPAASLCPVLIHFHFPIHARCFNVPMFISNALEPAAPVCPCSPCSSPTCVPLTGTRLVHLMPRSASLEQAGGLLRMTLRGHSGPVHKVVLSPNGRDVVTVSEDGTAQVGWVEEADKSRV